MKCIDREPVVAGTFYESDPKELRKQLKEMFADSNVSKENISAIIVPHAGYAYSGDIAARAFGQLNTELEYDHIFIIGSSHHVSLKGASVYNKGHYKTPLGLIPVDLDLANHLIESSTHFTYNESAHAEEHTIEVQLPFLQYHLKNINKIVPIIIGTQNIEVLDHISDELKPYFNERNLFVISTDLSHYPKDEDARVVDENTVNAICSNKKANVLSVLEENKKLLISNLYTSLCGWTSVYVLMGLTNKNRNYEYRRVLYGTSGDKLYQNRSRVVGYQSIAVVNKTAPKKELPQHVKEMLLQEARSAICNNLGIDSETSPDSKMPPGFEGYRSAFVSVYVSGELRGCIGQFDAQVDLIELVRNNAVSAAFTDSRFPHVEAEELPDLKIEISVLTPKEKIHSISQIELGRHGVYLQKGWNRGTFLPQVATKTQWSMEEFLGHLARDKAHIGYEGWKDAELFIFEAIIFSD